jgi:hypothetical protein
MNSDLQRSIRSLRDRERGVQPDAAWVHRTRATLLMQVQNTMPSRAVAQQHSEFFASRFVGKFARLLRGPALGTLSIFGLILGGSIASVSAADQALPGDALYPIKIVTEQARLAFAPDTSNKLKLKSEFTKRRVDELKEIIATPGDAREERAAQAADSLKRDLDTLKQQLNDVQSKPSPASQVAEAVKLVDQNSVEVMKALNEAGSDKLSLDVQEKVATAQAQAADVGVKALEVLVDTHKEAGESIVKASDISSSLAAHAQIMAVSVAQTKVLVESAAGLNASASSTLGGSLATSTVMLVKDAEKSLADVQVLADQEKLGEAIDKIKDATVKSFTAKKQAEQEVLALTTNASSSSSGVSLTSTSSTTAEHLSTTSSMNGVAATSTTTMTTSSHSSP